MCQNNTLATGILVVIGTLGGRAPIQILPLKATNFLGFPGAFVRFLYVSVASITFVFPCCSVSKEIES